MQDQSLIDKLSQSSISKSNNNEKPIPRIKIGKKISVLKRKFNADEDNSNAQMKKSPIKSYVKIQSPSTREVKNEVKVGSPWKHEKEKINEFDQNSPIMRELKSRIYHLNEPQYASIYLKKPEPVPEPERTKEDPS